MNKLKEGEVMMKLSDEMRKNCPAPDDTNCSCGWVEYAKEVAQLEAENESLIKHVDA